MKLKNLTIDEYNYPLTDDKIAKYPLSKRDESKVLIFEDGQIGEDIFKNIAHYIPAQSLLVTNNTKVIRARLEFFKATGARIEVFCLEPYKPTDYNQSFSSDTECEWLCIVGNLKKWKDGTLHKEIKMGEVNALLTIERIEKKTDAHVIKFVWNNPAITFSDIIENCGSIPIPPYLNRNAENSDSTAYQTIYSKHKGSVAAPTAGLHFTNEVLASLKSKQIEHHQITLHVGAGTFKPVSADIIGNHEMHTENFIITPQTIPQLLKHLGNITAVGTTTTRTLESLYWLGVKLHQSRSSNNFNFEITQWEPYELIDNLSVVDALEILHQKVLSSNYNHINAYTSIMIGPGYKFKIIDRLITNFHQPKSTLLLLISAFVGENWRKIYDHALQNKFRFLSYGDSCFLSNKKGQ